MYTVSLRPIAPPSTANSSSLCRSSFCDELFEIAGRSSNSISSRLSLLVLLLLVLSLLVLSLLVLLLLVLSLLVLSLLVL
ncbi:MAG: hypothetical protein RR895_02085 [Hydrogenoanaerobacterium sp.]